MYNIRSLIWDLHMCCSVIHFSVEFPFLLSKTVRCSGVALNTLSLIKQELTSVTVTKTEKPVIYNSNISSFEVRLVKDIYIFSMYVKYFFLQQAHQADTGNISSEFIPFILQYSHNNIIYRKTNIY